MARATAADSMLPLPPVIAAMSPEDFGSYRAIILDGDAFNVGVTQ